MPQILLPFAWEMPAKIQRPHKKKGRAALFVCGIPLNLADSETLASNSPFYLSYY